MKKFIFYFVVALCIIFITVSANSTYKYKVTNIKEYIYKNLKLVENDYKYIACKHNYIGEIAYLYQLYKAKGTLLVYINLTNNSIGSRIVPEIKVPNVFAFNKKKEILINSLAMGNKFYYISPSVKIYSFDSPSYNLSEPIPSESFFYWLGYKYLEGKKLQRKVFLFRYKYNNIQSYDIQDFWHNLKKQKLDIIDIKPYDNFLVFNTYKNDKSVLFFYDFVKNKSVKIYEGQRIFLDKAINNNLYFLDKRNDNLDLLIFDDIDGSIKKIYSFTNQGMIKNFSVFPYSFDKFIFAFSFENIADPDGNKNYSNIVIKDSNIIYNEVFNNIVNFYYDKRSKKQGSFYLYEDNIVEVLHY